MSVKYKKSSKFSKIMFNNKIYLLGLNKCFELNELSSLIYDLIIDGKTHYEIISLILREYDINYQTVLSDVEKTIEFFDVNKIILIHK